MFVTAYTQANYCRNDYVRKNSVKLQKNCSDSVAMKGVIPAGMEYASNVSILDGKMIKELSDTMQARPDSAKMLYQYGIDFLSKKVNKEQFLLSMSNLLDNVNEEQLSELNDDEYRYVGNYGIFFDLNGLDASKVKSEDILDAIESLLGR